MYRELGDVVRSMRPDVIHVLSEPWGALPMQSVFLERRRQTGARVSVHAADNIFAHGSKLEQVARRRILASVLPRLAGFVGWTGEVVELAHRFGLPESTPTLVVPAEASDPDRFVPVTERGNDWLFPWDTTWSAFSGASHRKKESWMRSLPLKVFGSEHRPFWPSGASARSPNG
jgi:hypothetical protein